MKKGWKKWMALSLAAVMTVSIAGCSGSDGEQTTNQSQAQSTQDETMEALKNPEYVYVPEYKDMPEGISIYNSVIKDGFLYSLNYEWDEEAGKQSTFLVKYPLEGGDETKVLLQKPEGDEESDMSLDSIQITSGGELIGLQRKWAPSTYDDEWTSTSSLVKIDQTGKIVMENDITAVMEEQGVSYFDGIVLDSKDNLYIAADSSVLLFSSDLKFHGKISVSGGTYSYINGLCQGKDEKIYAVVMIGTDTGSTVSLIELDYDNKAQGASYSNFPTGSGNRCISVGSEDDFIISDGTSLYGYSMEKQQSHTVLQWIDSDINGQYISGIDTAEDGRILVLIEDWETNESSMALLKKTPASEVVQKQVITLGCFYPDQELLSVAIKFNRQSDKYRITFRNYFDNSNGWSQELYNDAITNMQNAVISGASPDLIELSQLNAEQLANKGALEDLKAYMDKSSKLNVSDYFSNLVDCYTYNNALVAIPRRFYVQTMAGSSKLLGNIQGWTMKELVEFADRNQGKDLFRYVTKESMLAIMMQFNESAFIDWNTGKCNFDTQDFLDLLEFANRCPEEQDYDSSAPSEMTMLEKGDLLLSTVYISQFQDLQPYMKALNNEVTFVGFPTVDGKRGNLLSIGELFGISSRSEMKEGAWEFLEFYLSGESDSDRYNFGFPANRKQFEKEAAEAVKIQYYTDDNGDYILDEEGNPIQMNAGGGMSYEDGWSIDFTVPTQQEVDTIVSIIENARPISVRNEEIMKIINEEVAGFFSGQKPAKDVAGIIQRRVQMFVDENM
ncbi:MAG: extracellular solute-binding protein [Acetatifactor sp.]